jgi:phosphatidylglycerophosphate synthase
MERRPLAVRSTKWAHEAAKFLSKRNITPNNISILSVVFSLLAFSFYSLALDHVGYLFLAALCIQLRLICNLLDGMVAVEYGKKSIYGNLFNDIPDRFADVFIILGAGFYSQYAENSAISMNLAWSNAILAVVTAYIRVLGSSLGTPTNFSGIMAKPQRMALLTITSLICLIPGIHFPLLLIALAIMLIGQIVTIITRISFIANSLKEKEDK